MMAAGRRALLCAALVLLTSALAALADNGNERRSYE